MSIASRRRDFLRSLDCFVCNQQEAGICFSEDYSGDAFFAGVTAGLTYGKSLADSCAIGTRLSASVITSEGNTCPRFRPQEFGLDVAPEDPII